MLYAVYGVLRLASWPVTVKGHSHGAERADMRG